MWNKPTQAVTPLPATTPLYKTLDMPLSVFIDALIDDVTDNIENFPKLYTEYCELIGGKELVQKIEEVAEMVYLETKVKIAFLGVEMLRLKPSKAIFDEVFSLGYNTSVVEYSEDKIETFINQILPFVKLDGVDAQILRARNNGGAKQGYTRDYFSSMLNELLLVFKINVDESISVRRYVQLVLRYKSHKQTAEQ